MNLRYRQPSLLLKILLSTSVAITLLLGITEYFVQDQTVRTLSRSIDAEIQSSFQAYDALWKARADTLRSVSLVLSNMSDVRAAFGTRDNATIRDTAGEIWSRISQTDAVFLVTDPNGGVIASRGHGGLGYDVPAVRAAAPRFPSQATGVAVQNGHLYLLVLTPVYVQTASAPGLLNVLVAGYPIDRDFVEDLKKRTGGSDIVFTAAGGVVVSTLDDATTAAIAQQGRRGPEPQRVSLPQGDFSVLGIDLPDAGGQPSGSISIVRTLGSLRTSIQRMQRNLLIIWGFAMVTGLALSFVLARHILEPIRRLDQAAARISEQQYDTRVPVGGDDELGRLARTFNTMCRSIEDARNALIRQERISTIGRLSSSIVHDLRNPLAAIYGGAEMLIDGQLSPEQVDRISRNIYRSSRVIQDMLQELVDVSRGRRQPAEVVPLRDVIEAAVISEQPSFDEHNVSVRFEVDAKIEAAVERARMERVFVNLIGNALDVMPSGGSIDIRAEAADGQVLIAIEDTGPGISPDARAKLFEPFATSGKNGLGLGLALSRQTVLDHGGDLWAEPDVPGRGARFLLRLPVDGAAPRPIGRQQFSVDPADN